MGAFAFAITPTDIVPPLIVSVSDLQVFDVYGSSEGFPRDGLDEVLTQVSVKDNKKEAVTHFEQAHFDSFP